MATNQNRTPSATTPLLQGDSVTQISPTWYKYLNNLATNLNNMLSSLYALLSGAIFTGPVDTTQTTLTIAPATAAGHAVQLGQFTSNLPALLRTRGYYGLLDNYNMTRLPTNGAAPITVGAAPYGVAYCPTNDRIYVVNLGSNSVSVIIPATGVVTATITVGANPYCIAY